MNLKNMLIALCVGLSVLLSACDRRDSAPLSTEESSPSSAAKETAEASDPAPPLSGEASESKFPFLRVNEHEESNGAHQWVLAGDRIGKLTIRLLFISNGRSTVASESVLASKGADGAKETVRISLRTEDSSPSLAVSFDNLIAQRGNVDESAKLPKGVLKMGSFAMEESTGLKEQNTKLLYHAAYRSEGVEEGSYGEDLDSMITASKEGLTIVAITLDWEPK